MSNGQGFLGQGLLRSPAFLHRQNSIDWLLVEAIDMSARPADLEKVDDIRLAQSKVNAQIVLGIITAAAAHFLDLRMLAGDATNARADRTPVRLYATALHLEPVVAG